MLLGAGLLCLDGWAGWALDGLALLARPSVAVTSCLPTESTLISVHLDYTCLHLHSSFTTRPVPDDEHRLVAGCIATKPRRRDHPRCPFFPVPARQGLLGVEMCDALPRRERSKAATFFMSDGRSSSSWPCPFLFVFCGCFADYLRTGVERALWERLKIHRDTATPLHRYTATPQHRVLWRRRLLLCAAERNIPKKPVVK